MTCYVRGELMIRDAIVWKFVLLEGVVFGGRSRFAVAVVEL